MDMESIRQRLRGHMVVAESGCHDWTGSRGKWGYGAVRIGHKIILAHRASYAAFVGPIPEGMLVLHKCDNPACINYEHLFLGTHQDNMRDRNAKGRARGGSNAGERHPSARLTQIDGAEIRKIAGTASQRKIAQMFGVSQGHISNINNLKTWKA